MIHVTPLHVISVHFTDTLSIHAMHIHKIHFVMIYVTLYFMSSLSIFCAHLSHKVIKCVCVYICVLRVMLCN